MSDGGFAFHRNGSITFTDQQSGEVFTLYAPKLGTMREIEEYGTELGESFGLPEMRDRLNEITRELAVGREAVEAAKESGNVGAVAEAEAAYADLSSRVQDENEQTARQLIEMTKKQSLAWFVRVIQLCGSDNWPRLIDKGTSQPMKDENGHDRIDVDQLPATVRNSQLVADIKAHWWSPPLADSPSNGAASVTSLTAAQKTP